MMIYTEIPAAVEQCHLTLSRYDGGKTVTIDRFKETTALAFAGWESSACVGAVGTGVGAVGDGVGDDVCS